VPDNYAPPAPPTLRWVERELRDGARVVHRQRLVGGLTAFMDLLTIDAGRGRFDVVLRRWPADSEWADGLVEREEAGLRVLARHDLPVPAPLGFDPTGDAAGIRCSLTTALPGQPLLAPSDPDGWVRQLAEALARIHALPPVLSAEHHGWYDESADHSWLGDPGLASAAVQAARGHPAPQQRSLVHGDYQHFNILWADEQLSAVVDWPSVGSGQRGLDVGHCRLNLAVLYSAELAEAFLRYYETAAGVTVDPRVDLRSLMCFAPGWSRFIPIQVAGRAPVDGAGMAARVTQTVRAVLRRLG